jgi:transcriptional regulator with XRE-family HTH domain
MGLKAALAKRRRHLTEIIAELRREAGLTQSEVAERLGTDQSTYSKIEKGVRRMDFIEVLAWADAIGVDPVELIVRVRKKGRR